MHLKYFAVAALAALGSATPQRRTIACRDIQIPILTGAQNKAFPSDIELEPLVDPDPNALRRLLATTGNAVASGQYTIGARYCEPANQVESRRDTLQILVHGLTYNKDYWSGGAFPGTRPGQNQYSWVEYASNEGYPTLSIDRLCSGNSSRPNGLLACQLPLQAEIMHKVINTARSGLPEAGRAFSRIIYAGHSYGSLVANDLSVHHPGDVDSYLLTGFSLHVFNGVLGIVIRPAFRPAAIVNPEKYGDLLLDPAYLLPTDTSGAYPLLYFGSITQEMVDFENTQRETVTIGELLTALLGQGTSSSFVGSVFVINGNEDGVFCYANPQDSLLAIRTNCTNGFTEGVRSAYPNARAFGFYNIPNTGHCWHSHTTAQEGFRVAHDWLTEQGF